jgi:hypothetical protein
VHGLRVRVRVRVGVRVRVRVRVRVGVRVGVRVSSDHACTLHPAPATLTLHPRCIHAASTLPP